MVRRWHLDSLRKAVTNKETGAFHPGQYLEKLRTEFGTANAKALHGPEVVDDLIQVGKDLKLFRDQPGAGGSFAMTLAETGPILSLFTGGGIGAAAGGATGAAAGAAGALTTLAVTVKGFNKWLSNPKRVKDVLTVAKTSPRSGKATAATLRLLHALSTEDIVNNESGNRMTLQEVSRRNAGRRAIQQEVGQ